MDPNAQVPGNIGGPVAPSGATNKKMNTKLIAVVVATIVIAIVGIALILNSSSTQRSITEDAAGATVDGNLDSVATPAELITQSNQIIEDAASLATDRTLIRVELTEEEDVETNQQLVEEFEEAIENGELTPDDIPSVRYAGANRYATAANVSQRAFPDPSILETVVLVNGGSEIDMALASGLADTTTSILLVETNIIPEETRTELRRIAAAGKGNRIELVIVGGNSVVSALVSSTASQTDHLATSNVTRLGGASRYDTAVAISNYLYPGEFPDVVIAYIANANSYADIMAATNGTNSPVLLVDAASSPEATSAELCRLGSEHVIVVGGESVVNTNVLEGIQDQIQEYRTRPDSRVSCAEENPNFYRYRDLLSLGGESRAETSVAVSKRNYARHSGSAILVNGFSAADILSATVLSQSQDGLPILYVNNSSVSAATVTEMKRLAALQIFVVGGEAAISQDVITDLRCQQFGGCAPRQSVGRPGR